MHIEEGQNTLTMYQIIIMLPSTFLVKYVQNNLLYTIFTLFQIVIAAFFLFQLLPMVKNNLQKKIGEGQNAFSCKILIF